MPNTSPLRAPVARIDALPSPDGLTLRTRSRVLAVLAEIEAEHRGLLAFTTEDAGVSIVRITRPEHTVDACSCCGATLDAADEPCAGASVVQVQVWRPEVALYGATGRAA